MSNRTRTRDLLIEYHLGYAPPRPEVPGEEGTSFIPLDPKTQAFNSIYPWENPGMLMINELYTLAKNSGFTGTIDDFKTNFGYYLERQDREIIFSIYNNFPLVGDSQHLYFDLNEKILYYWDGEYIPVNAMLIANTTLEGGEA